MPLGTEASEVMHDATNPRPGVSGYARIVRVTFLGEYELKSVIHIYTPFIGNGRAIIWAEGHGPGSYSDTVMNYFLSHGYSVALCEMPMYGSNESELYPGPWRHDLLASHSWTDTGILRVFIEPMVRAVSWMRANKSFKEISSLGISGGGWAATIHAAVDERVRVSIAVSGSIPASLRLPGEWGDFEQGPGRPPYTEATWPGLYYLASAGRGRAHVQVFNEFDSCCFASSGRLEGIHAYTQDVNSLLIANGEGGSFRTWVDRGQVSHTVSSSTMDMVRLSIISP